MFKKDNFLILSIKLKNFLRIIVVVIKGYNSFETNIYNVVLTVLFHIVNVTYSVLMSLPLV